MSYNANDRYSTTPCTPFMVAGRVHVPPPCPIGWEDGGLMPAGSCVSYDGQPGWRRICTKSKSYDPVSNVSCCLGEDLTPAQKEECKKRNLEPYQTGCDLLMYNSCNISGSTDCDRYRSAAPDRSWYDNRTYRDGPPPVQNLSDYHTRPPRGYYPYPQTGYPYYQPYQQPYYPPVVPIGYPNPLATTGVTPQNWWSAQYAVYPNNAYRNYAATARDETAYFCNRNPQVCHALAYNY